MKSPVRVAIIGAAGQIGYQLAFRIASGQMLGSDQPVVLQLLEITPALELAAQVWCFFHRFVALQIRSGPGLDNVPLRRRRLLGLR